jgi:Na+/citrate or Na+/malate symporter
MDPDLNSLAVMIPIVAIGGFFAWMIALAISKAYLEKLRLQGRGPATVAGQEEVLAALEQVRREVAELAERVDFTERLLAKPGTPARKDA